MRIPATELDAAVAETIARELDDPIGLTEKDWFDVPIGSIPAVCERAGHIASRLRARDRETVQALGLGSDGVRQPIIAITSDARLTRTGRAMRLIATGGQLIAPTPSPSLTRLIARERRWWAELRKGEIDITRFAAQVGVTQSYMTRVTRLAFLAPDIVEAMLGGTAPAQLGLTALLDLVGKSACWEAQRAELVRLR